MNVLKNKKFVPGFTVLWTGMAMKSAPSETE